MFPSLTMRIMMTMDSLGSDHSPPLSENAGSSWTHWENEISSISGLNAGSSNELYCLVEDKDIAARAVAFVVNSTRKGIVPLCADVANLLRSKRSLEKKIYLMKRENEALRSSTSISFRTSHSTSPAPPSTSSYTDKSLLHDQTTNIQDRSRPCSRCSQCSSTISYSPKFEKTYSFKGTGHLNSPSLYRDSRRRGSSRSRTQQQQNGITTTTTEAIVHGLPLNYVATDSNDSLPPVSRKNSLPEIISQPDGHIKRISPQVSKETQCTLQDNVDHEENLTQTLKLNHKLSEELTFAKKEIESLKDKLRELELNHALKNTTDSIFNIENESDDKKRESRREKLKGSVFKPIVFKSVPTSLKKGKSQKAELSLSTALYPEPLTGCKCSACEESIGYSDRIILDDDVQKFTVGSNLRIQVGDHVSDKENRSGYIKYIGHLDRIGQPNMLFAGLELDLNEGSHDGFFNGKRYFFCNKDNGVLIPLQDVVSKTKTSKHGSEKKNTPKISDLYKLRHHTSNKAKAESKEESSSSSNIDK
ncbi:uncharacterized protein LOC126807804 isoform X2 [Patella vulgata]|nr:uncharacterized protein LOC126807804 isoform X2 [Patella vulgata]